ncbi:hypothetical protein ASF80_11250 [Microbacterium sp. Leaf159]|nr:hypothetical protein ASF80_11250 [Microbacterium sp. Leaf159]
MLAFGFGIAAIVLSPWLILLGRAAYRDGPEFQRNLWNAVPLWGASITGVLALIGPGTSLVGWRDLCLPAYGWSTPGVIAMGVGVAIAVTAVARMIVGRIRVGNGTEKKHSSDETSPQQPQAEGTRTSKLPLERRRVIVAYAVTYGAAVIVVIVGVGLAG